MTKKKDLMAVAARLVPCSEVLTEQMKSVLDFESKMHSGKIVMGRRRRGAVIRAGRRVYFQGLHAFRFECFWRERQSL